MGKTARILGAMALFFGAFGANAQLAEPLADINTGIGVDRNSGPSQFVKITDSLTIFVATDRVHGAELWRTDGTTVGTVLLADICPGLCSSDPSVLTRLGNHVYFRADDGSHGSEPWRVDTTSLIANLVGDVVPGAASSNPDHFVQANLAGATAVYFTAIPAETSTSRNFYVTSGVPAGTSLAVATAMGSFSSLVSTGGRIYFAATDANTNLGREVYRFRFINGAHAVQLAGDINPGPGSSNPQLFTQVGNLLFFTADDGTQGRELWKQDLVGETLSLVEDINLGVKGSSPGDLTAFAGALYFTADNNTGAFTNRELWKSDGSAPGTDILLEIQTSTSVGSNPTQLRIAGSQLIFLATAFSTGNELYRSDGSAPGTVLIKDHFPGDAGFVGFVGFASAVGASYYFVLNSQLWATDGTAPSVRTIGAPFGFVTALADGGARVYLAAGQEGVGQEPFRSTLGTSTHALLRNIGDEIGHSDPFGFAPRGASTVFAAFDDIVGTEPRAASGPDLPVALLGDTSPSSPFSNLSQFEPFERAGNLLFFAPTSSELWATDGTLAGTAPVVDFESQPIDGTPRCLLGINAELYFYLDPDDSNDPDQLFRSDGTPAGTVPIVSDPDVQFRNECFAGQRNIALLGGNLFFVARDDAGLTGFELYRSNGTGGATLVRDIRPGPDSSLPGEMVVVGSTIYFPANGGEGVELWKSNGTAQGTVLVKDIHPTLSSTPRDLRELNGMLVFTATDGSSGRELYVSDGTSGGTQRVVDLHAGAGSAFGNPASFSVSGGNLYFAATETTALGSQLYRSNGTAPGTERLTSQAGGLTPQDLAPVGNGWIMFSGATPATGRELWFSNGTVAGTIPLDDIAAGPASSSPRQLALSSDYVYFSADDGNTGREPWVIATPSDEVFADSFE